MLYDVIHQLYEAHVVSFDYGQRHSRELDYARATCARLGIEHKIVGLYDLQPLLRSSLTFQGAVPEGHYAAETMKATVVPNRNAMLLSIAYAWALSLGARAVFYGAHSGDHAIYPDCRPEFFHSLQAAFNVGSAWETDPPSIVVPYLGKTKAEIVQLGETLHVPFAETWSCYTPKGGTLHCGRCGTCVERQEAFFLADVYDPTQYLDSEYWKEAVQRA